MTAELDWRCVVTGHAAAGRAAFRADGRIPVTARRGPARVGRLLWLDEPPESVDDGAPGEGPETPASGSIGVAALVVEPTSAWLVGPEPHRPNTLDLYVVVSGRLVVDLAGEQAALGPGEVFVPRDQPHRLRTAADVETRLVVTRCVPDPDAVPGVETALRGKSGPAARVRRVVAGSDGSQPGRPVVVHDGDPGVMLVIGDATDPVVGLADVWELGGLVAGLDQGGDAPSPWELEPRDHGLKVISTELAPTDTGPVSGDAGWHTTATIDVDVIIEGVVEMYLADLPPVTLRPGDILVQRGTNHRWRPVGDRSLRMATVMIGVRP